MSDLYDDFNFRVKWDGQYVAGVSKVSGLVRSTEVVQHRDGGDTPVTKSPGRTVYEAITLERGRTSDTAFESWANSVPGASLNGAVAGAAYQKDIVIYLYNEAGQLVMAFNVLSCWPSRYETLSALNASDHDVVLEQLTLEHEGWERDMSVVAPGSTP
jgi:phage tail-like protein